MAGMTCADQVAQKQLWLLAHAPLDASDDTYTTPHRNSQGLEMSRRKESRFVTNGKRASNTAGVPQDTESKTTAHADSDQELPPLPIITVPSMYLQ